MTDIGQKVMEMIIEAKLFRMECPAAPEEPCICVWSANAPEQIEAFITEAMGSKPE